MTSPSAPAGWYPDPTGSGHQRLFDGETWTEQTRTVPHQLTRRVIPPPAAPPDPAPLAGPQVPALTGAAPRPAGDGPEPVRLARRPFSAAAQTQRQTTAVSADSAQALLVGSGMPPTPANADPVPAGWYPDPARGGGLRFFDGVKWTARTRRLPPQRGRRIIVPAAVVAAQLLVVSDAAAVRRAHRPTPVARIRVSKASATPSLSRASTRTGSIAATLATLTMLLGIAAAGYFSWNLWGSDVYTSYQQSQLEEQFKRDLQDAPTTTAPSPVTDPVAPTTVAPPPVPPMPAGDASPVGRITVPKIGLDIVFVAGTDVEDLKKGPGLWLHGVFPGTPGNATISGHRTTYGGPFRHLDALDPGDRIYVDVPGQPQAVYEVRGTTIASPFAVQVTRQVPGVRLTLTTCDPVGSAAHRMVVQAELVEGAWVDQAVAPDSWQLLE